MTPEQIEIRELKKRLQRVEMERDILKGYRALDVRLPEQFSLVERNSGARFLLPLYATCLSSSQQL